MEPFRQTRICLTEKRIGEVFKQLHLVSNKSNVETLKIERTSIVNLNGNVLNGFVNLIDLDLSHCSLMVLENGIFEPLSHLKSINLGFNLISSIANDLFRNNRELNRIILKSNVLVNVNEAAFSGLTHLETLDLSYNHISKLETEFSNCPNLKTIFLNNNEIQQIVSSRTFTQLGNLTNLDLNSNKIQEIYFECSKTLCYLNLSNNEIRKLQLYYFLSLTNLKVLNLKNNSITGSITDLKFKNNAKLLDLDLSNNRNVEIGKNAFKNCKN